MPNNKYSVIVFDLGNVLLPFNYDIVINRLDSISPELGQKFYRFYQENYHIHRSFERGDMTEDEFIGKMLGAVDHKIDKETFCNIYSKVFKVNEDVAALLPELKKNYQLVLLSNTNSIHMEYGWKDYDFLKHFEKLILSHEAKAVKPEAKIYKTVEAYTQKPADQHIFIDDIADYVQGAKNVGWDAVQFINYDKLISDFKERNII